jgi:hypothetical protein
MFVKIVGNQIKTFVELTHPTIIKEHVAALAKENGGNCIIICFFVMPILIFNKIKIKIDFAEETI